MQPRKSRRAAVEGYSVDIITIGRGRHFADVQSEALSRWFAPYPHSQSSYPERAPLASSAINLRFEDAHAARQQSRYQLPHAQVVQILRIGFLEYLLALGHVGAQERVGALLLMTKIVKACAYA